MVAVRSAHLNTEGEFALDQWIASLGVANPHSCDRLAETWRYCEAQTQGILTSRCCCGAASRWWKFSRCSAWISKACAPH